MTSRVVHFVCSGNSFRSRLAEAYLNSLQLKGYRATSSGTHAYLDPYGQISKAGAVVMTNEGLIPHTSPEKTQLSQQLLDTADIVVCMNKTVYREALRKGIHFPVRTYIWNIDDIERFTTKQLQQLSASDEPIVVKTIFRAIQQHVDDLVAFLQRPSPTELVDVVDENGKPYGKPTDIATIHEHGWWHSGVHIGLYTASDKVLLEHRPQSIVFNPGRWEMSLGGVVASGETPVDAILREIQEEVGVRLKKSDLHKLFVWRYNHFLPHYGYHNRCLIHSFIAQIPEDTALHLCSEEVSGTKWVSMEAAREMNNAPDASKLIRTQAYNKIILDAIEERLSHTNVGATKRKSVLEL